MIIGAILGIWLLGEQLMVYGWMGINLLCVGIALVATDPGEKVNESLQNGATHIPPLVVWIVPALVCASAYGVSL